MLYMQHSLCDYLQRQSTQTLECFLQNCISGVVSEDYTYLIPVIMEILKQRAQQESV